MGVIDLYSIAAILAVTFIVKRYHGLLNFIDPVSFFFLSNLLLGFIGIFYRGRYTGSWAYISDDAALILIGGLSFFGIGVLLGNLSISKIRYLNSNEVFSNNVEKKIGVLILYAGLACGAILTLGYLFLTGADFWGGDNFEDSRVIGRQGFGWLVLLSLSVVSVSTIFIIAINRKYGGPIWKDVAVFLVSFFLLLIPGNRAPALELLVAFGFLYCFFRWGKVPVWTAVVGGGLVFALLAVLGVIREGEAGDFELLVLKGIWRPYVNLANFETVFASFPESIQYLWGRGYLIDIEVLLPGYQPNFGTWLKEELGKEFQGGSITIGLSGELYANFSEIGVYLGYFIFGFFLVFISKVMSSFQATQHIVMRYIVSMSVKGMSVSGVFSPILYLLIPMTSVYIIYIMLFYLASMIFSIRRSDG